MPLPQFNLRIPTLVAEGFEDNELWWPTYFLRALGIDCPLVGKSAGDTFTGKHGLPATADLGYGDLDADRFDGVMIPGGWAPDHLRMSDEVNQFVKRIHDAGKLVATICHGPWVAISAGICEGHTMTSTTALIDDLRNAGATWVDEESVTCGNVITARKPDDLPAFGRAMVAFLESRE